MLKLLRQTSTDDDKVDTAEAARQSYQTARDNLRRLDDDLRALDAAEWQAREAVDLDASAHALLNGEEVVSLPPDREARRLDLQRRRPVIARAAQIARERYDEIRRREQREHARSLRGEHRAAIADIWRALRLLSDANRREREIHNKVGGLAVGVLPPAALGAVGTLAEPGSPASAWAAAIRRMPEYADLLTSEAGE